MDNYLLFIFEKFSPKTMHHSRDFGANLKIHKNPILTGISSKISTQHIGMIYHFKNLIYILSNILHVKKVIKLMSMTKYLAISTVKTN